MKYKVGQILTTNTDVVVEKAFSGEKVIIPKENAAGTYLYYKI